MEWNRSRNILYFVVIFYSSWLEVTSQGQGPVSITFLGCYKDRITKPSQSIFSTVFHQVNIVRWWPNSNHIIHACATAAAARGYQIFSIQDFGDCRWGPNAERDYAKYGHGYYCYRGLGWISSGSVYRVQNLAPVNGQWTNWSRWSSCSATCNGGTRSRRRSCSNPAPSNGGTYCRGISSETQFCNRNRCQIAGVWSSWSPWGSCSRSCGGGTRSRVRSCTSRSQFSASAVCQGPRSRIQRCSTNRCPTNGAWSVWGSWSSCSRTCGIGTQTRSRTCSNPIPSIGGVGCPGPSSENRRCSSSNCPVCVEGTIVTDRCGQRCRCSGGRPVGCTRVRREFTSMSRSDREKYIRTVITASTDRRYKPAYDRLITLHKTIFRSGIHERDHFLPWHRWYVLQYENLLRRIDCTVTVSYWDWSVVSQTPWRGRASDLWYIGNSGFGRNGQQTPEQCVTSGPFRRGNWNVVPSAGGGCLRRQLNLTSNPPDSVAVAEVLRTRAVDFDSFEISLRINLHDTVHCLIGGHMCSFDSATSPEFMLHHGFIDKIWMDWQRQSSAHRNAHFPRVAENMPGTRQLHARAVLDNFRLPGGVRVQYQATTVPQLRSVLRRLGEMKMSALSQIPRGHFSVLSKEAIKLFNVSKAEVGKAIRLGLKLLPWSTSLPGSKNSMETSLGFRIDSLKKANFVRGR